MLYYLLMVALLQAVATYIHAEPLFINYHKLQVVVCMRVTEGGKPFGIEGKTVEQILWLRNEIKKIMGIPLRNQIEKRYSLKGQECTLTNLVAEEEKLNLTFAEKEKAIIEKYNASHDEKAYQQELIEWQREYDIEKILINAELKKAIATFLLSTEVFVAQIRLFKGLVCELIDLWCQHNNRPDSFLRQWTSMEANENEELKKNMDTCAKLHVFLTDLNSFLLDLVESCPRAFKDYKERIANKQG